MDEAIQLGWLSGMSAAFQKDVLARVEQRSVNAQHSIYMQGQEARGLYGLMEGVVEVSILSPGGGPGLIYLARRGWWFGALEIFTKRPRRFQIQARTDCRVLFLASAQVREICQLAPDRWEGFAQLMCANYESLVDAVSMMRDPSPVRRVARALLILHIRQSEQEHVIEATQEEIASVANVSARSAATALGRLEKAGLIKRGYGTTTLINPVKLLQTIGKDTGEDDF